MESQQGRSFPEERHPPFWPIPDPVTLRPDSLSSQKAANVVTQFFQERVMASFTEEGVLEQELAIIADEAMKRHLLWDEDGTDRNVYYHAQIAICALMMEFVIHNDGITEAQFVEACEGALEVQYPLYKRARVENDRSWMIITLARIRFTKTLLRRLHNPDRRALLVGDVDRTIFH